MILLRAELMIKRISHIFQVVVLLLACSCGQLSTGQEPNGPQNPPGSTSPSGPGTGGAIPPPKGQPAVTEEQTRRVKDWTIDQIKDPLDERHKGFTKAQMAMLTGEQLKDFPIKKLKDLYADQVQAI